MLANKTELVINLASLKRHDPYISEIVDCSTHVALYRYLIKDQVSEWEKTDVEGALFVYKRVAPPLYGFTILNRLNMNNLTEPLTKDLEFQTQNPFLLYKNARTLIYGIWFYDTEHCNRIGALLSNLCKEAGGSNDNKSNQNANVSPPILNQMSHFGNNTSINSTPVGNPKNNYANEKPTTTPTGNVDIMSLLSKAQDKFEKQNQSVPENGNNTPILNGQTQLFGEPVIKPQPVHPRKLDVASLFNKTKPETQKVEIMPVPKKETNAVLSQISNSILPPTNLMVTSFPQIQQSEEKSQNSLPANKLISPEDFERCASTATAKKPVEKNSQHFTTPLTENQLKSCLIRLIETDSEFVTKIHQAYLDSLK